MDAAVEHLPDTVEGLSTVCLRRLVSLLPDDVAHGEDFGVRVGRIATGVIVTDATQAHDSDLQLCHLLSLRWFFVN